MIEATKKREEVEKVTLESINYNLLLIDIDLRGSRENRQASNNYFELKNSLDKLRQFKRDKADEFYIATAAWLIAVVGGISLSETGYNTFIGDMLIVVGVAIGVGSLGKVAWESKVYDDGLQTISKRVRILHQDTQSKDPGPAGTE